MSANIIKRPTNKRGRVYCGNCGKYGHQYKKCNEPITSIGIINIRLHDVDEGVSEKLQELYAQTDSFSKSINILKDNNKSYNTLKYISEYKNKVEFLLIRRKNTLGYIEFIRGRYEVDDTDHIISLFEQMTDYEIAHIRDSPLKQMWEELWNSTSKSKMYEHEYELSKEKFERLKQCSNADLTFYIDNIKPKYKCPEWGFPKGRRNYHEKNVDCARREFAEETGYKSSEYTLLDRIYPMHEVFMGTNGVLYKHIYFLGLSTTDRDPKIDNKNKHQVEEIGDIGWFTYSEAIEKIRPYHIERKKLLNEIYLFIITNILKLTPIPIKQS